MTRLSIFTIVARNYLPLALTLADSVARHHPEADLRIFVADGLEGLPDQASPHRLEDLHTLLDASFEEQRFQYNITEFCTAVKPWIFQKLVRETDAEVFYYLDPDTWLFGRLDPVHDSKPGATLFLAPHLLHCRPGADHAYPEYKHLWEGVFNLGFCAIRRTDTAHTLLEWWAGNLRHHCYADRFDGLHTDQKWMDYAPAYFGEALHVLRHEGVNVAHWNLDERALTLGGPTGYRAGADSLLLFHFSGFDFAGHKLTRHAPEERQAAYASPALSQLAQAYRQAVHARGYAQHITLPYRYDTYSDGCPVTALQRRLYRELGGAARFARPFDAQGPLRRLLARERLLDRSAAARVAHSRASLPSAGRLTSVAERLLRAFLRTAGASRYAYLLKFFGRYARPESHAFLLKDKG